jgi:hypothetical protein
LLAFFPYVPAEPGLPDDLFSNQISQFGLNFGGSCKGRYWSIFWPVGTFCGDLVYIFCGYLVYFPPFWYVDQEKRGNPATKLNPAPQTKRITWLE